MNCLMTCTNPKGVVSEKLRSTNYKTRRMQSLREGKCRLDDCNITMTQCIY